MRTFLFLLCLLMPALAATKQEIDENRTWTRELRAYAQTQPAATRAVLDGLLTDVMLLASLDEHKAHDALAALRAQIARGEVPTPVGNYGQVLEGKLLRGAQPSPHGLRWLARRGVGTIVLLRQPGVEETNYPGWSRADYVRDCQELGMSVVELSIRDRTLPTPEQIEAFLRTVDDSSKPCFVHCSAGIGRTGVLAGLYLRHRGVDPQAALAHNLLYQAQPDRYPDHAIQAAYMMAYPLAGKVPPAPAVTGPTNPVLAGLREGVQVELLDLAPLIVVRGEQRFMVTGPARPNQDPWELNPVPVLAEALRSKRLVRLGFTRQNLDQLGGLSRALPAQQKMALVRLAELEPEASGALSPAEFARVRAWLGPGVPVEVALPPTGGREGVLEQLEQVRGKAEIVSFPVQPPATLWEELARRSLACEVGNAQGLPGWYLEVLGK